MDTSEESDDLELVDDDMLVLMVVCGRTVVRCEAIAERGPLLLSCVSKMKIIRCLNPMEILLKILNIIKKY